MKENEISKVIVDAAIEVHRELGGPGLVSEFNAEPQRRRAAKKRTHLVRIGKAPQ